MVAAILVPNAGIKKSLDWGEQMQLRVEVSRHTQQFEEYARITPSLFSVFAIFISLSPTTLLRVF